MDRTIPFDINAERMTLGSLLLERDGISAVLPWLPAESFYLEKHGWVYAAIVRCYARRVPPDPATVADELRRHEQLDLVGGLAYLYELSSEVPTAVHLEYYARIVRRTALLRQLIETGGRITALGYEEQHELEETMGRAEQMLFGVTKRLHTNAGFVDCATGLEHIFEALQDLERGRGITGLQTGFPDLDDLTGGFYPSDLIVLAGRPGMGKSGLMLSMAYWMAVSGARVGIFSLEMSAEQLYQRLMALYTGIETKRIKQGFINDDDRARIVDAIEDMRGLSLEIDDTPGIRLSELLSKARQRHAAAPFDALFIDYLQKIRSGNNHHHDRYREVSEIARSLKDLARELRIPVIALSQLSRELERRSSKVPMLSDLRDSGEIEQEANTVLFIYREEYYDKDAVAKKGLKGLAEIHVAKGRDSGEGIVSVRFNATSASFATWERRRSPNGH